MLYSNQLFPNKPKKVKRKRELLTKRKRNYLHKSAKHQSHRQLANNHHNNQMNNVNKTSSKMRRLHKHIQRTETISHYYNKINQMRE